MCWDERSAIENFAHSGDRNSGGERQRHQTGIVSCDTGSPGAFALFAPSLTVNDAVCRTNLFMERSN